CQEHCRLNHSIETTAGSLEHRRQVCQNLPGLFGDSSRDELTGLRIDRDLTRDEHKTTRLDGLRVGADCGRCIVGVDLFSQNKGGILAEAEKKHKNSSRALQALDVEDAGDALDRPDDAVEVFDVEDLDSDFDMAALVGRD